MKTGATATEVRPTPLRTNTGDLVHFKIIPGAKAEIRSYTVTLKDHEARFIQAECRRLVKVAFPDHDDSFASPIESGDHGMVIVGKSAELPRFSDEAGIRCLGPVNGRVRLDGILKPVMRDGRCGVIFLVREVIVMPASKAKAKVAAKAPSKAPAKVKRVTSEQTVSERAQAAATRPRIGFDHPSVMNTASETRH